MSILNNQLYFHNFKGIKLLLIKIFNVCYYSIILVLLISYCIVVSGSRDATLRVWDIQTGECKKTLQGHFSAVRWYALYI